MKYRCLWNTNAPFQNLSNIGLIFHLDLSSTDLNIDRGHLLLIKDYLPTKFETSGATYSWVIGYTRCGRLTWPLTLTFDLLTWISIGIILSSWTIYLPRLKLLGESVLELSTAQGEVDWHCLWTWLWPTDLNINRDHLLIKDYLPTKFEAFWTKRSWVIKTKRSWVINCTRWSRMALPLTLTFDLLTLISIGIIYSSRTINLLSWKLLGQSVLELSIAQGEVYWHDLWPWPLSYCPEYQKGSFTHQRLSNYQVWCALDKAFLSYQLHKVKGPDRHTDGRTDRPTDRHVQSNMPHLLRVGGGGGHKYSWNDIAPKFRQKFRVWPKEFPKRFSETCDIRNSVSI